MRFKSAQVDGYTVYAVTGPNVTSFAIDRGAADTTNLLGFAIYRVDTAENEAYWMYGFKVFKSVIPQPDDKTLVTTHDHPVQSFVWDDFTCKDQHVYEYRFHPVTGTPKNLQHGNPIAVRVKTEPLFSTVTHDVFFNRGVASSQAYARKFGNERPDKLTPAAKQTEAWEWLSRKLDDGLYRFIDEAQSGDTLLGCFYEFRYAPVLDKLKAAQTRGVTLKLIVDGKKNGSAKEPENFPRDENKKAIAKAAFAKDTVTYREIRPSVIQHNKFLVLLKGAAETPKAVWTGSTNISEGGIFGQTNVGHWTRDGAVATSFRDYWTILEQDPGGEGNSAAAKAANKKFRDDVEAILPAAPADLAAIPAGTTAVFSPRTGLDLLHLYEQTLDEAQKVACITLAFGIGKGFKDRLKDNTIANALIFLLLERKDVPNKKSKEPFIAINAKNNAYSAWGAYLDEPIYQWTRETTTRHLSLNKHVAYIHSKFLLHDPLSADPVVITGSANFSVASTNDNDENMLIIRGDQRVADIYFTEFNRIFHHYYFRSVWEDLHRDGKKPLNDDDSLFLVETDAWLAKYAPKTIRTKRVQMFVDMQGIAPPPP